jgi:NAD(P)-dependent dehydrogenase (short-subunit alcohol dehydrogenase family)
VSWRTALVTGASSGIGRELARALAADGAEVALAARRDGKLRELAADIQRAGGRARVVPLDLDDADAAAATIAELDAAMGGLDLVVANAGAGPALDAPPWSWQALRAPLHVNLCGAAATLTAALPAMIARGRGHLAGISSLAAFGALPASAAYCTPKAGLDMLLECLRLDLARYGIAVTTVHLGFVETPMVAHRQGPMPQKLHAADAAQRIATALRARPADISLPQPLATATRLAGRLPRVLRQALLRLAAAGERPT